MFDVHSLSDPRVTVPLLGSREELIALFESVEHEKFRDCWPSYFHFLPDNTTDRSSVAYLARYCENGGSSKRCAVKAQAIFNKIFPFSYEAYEDAGFVERARSWRYQKYRGILVSVVEETQAVGLPDDSSSGSPPYGDDLGSLPSLTTKFKALLRGLIYFWVTLKVLGENSPKRPERGRDGRK